MVGSCFNFRNANLGRRDFLRAGALAFSGLGLPDLLRARTAAGETSGQSFGRAKSCILLFMTGGPSQIDTWDPKPDQPAEIRGEFQPIATSLPGVQICEHFPRLARLADRYAIVRSLCHDDTDHSSGPHYLLTGRQLSRGPEGEWPCYGSVLARLGRGESGLLPFVRLRPSIPNGPENLTLQTRGAGAGWLGEAFSPYSLDGDLLDGNYRSDNLVLRLAPERLRGRHDLRQKISRQADDLERSLAGKVSNTMYERAYQLLVAGQARRAFDVSQEPDKIRERYGRNLHGHSVLMARRLVEAGVPLVTVFYQNDLVGGEDSTAWDTHGGNFPLLKNLLMPAADQALSALLEDLHERGMLDETLVVWVGEFGREPKISKPGLGNTGNLGRNHWSQCFSGVLAGGGIRGGQVYGASDNTGGYVKDRPVSPADFAATLYHCLGVDPHTTLIDAAGRPQTICQGRPIDGLII